MTIANSNSTQVSPERVTTAPISELSKDPLSKLSQSDKALFFKYGFGPVEELSFNTIHKAFEYQAQNNPDLVAVTDAEQSLTYAELDAVSTALAIRLQELGVLKGDLVPLFLERSISMVVGIFAILKTGAAYTPLHVGVAPEQQLKFVSEAADAKVLISLEKFEKTLNEIIPTPCLAADQFVKTFFAQPGPVKQNFTSPQTDTNSRCMVLFTSGTTGKPNGVQVTHKNLCNIVLTSPGNLGIRPGTKVGQILSISFDMAAWEIFGCLANGGTLMIRGSDIAATASKANVIIATPTVLGRVDPTLCKDIKTVAVAGEPCPRSLADTWSDHCYFYNNCGPTETTIVNTMQLHKRDAEILSIGKPTPNNTVYVLGEDGLPCAIGEVGEMWAGGDCVTEGYLNAPDLTAERYRIDPYLGKGSVMFNTRDLGRWTTSGELEHLGRTDDQVKIRGFRVELDSVSAALESLDTCERAVTMKLDNKWLVSFVAPLGVDSELAQQRVAKRLPYYCVPKYVMALPALPTTDRGKIDKRVLLKTAQRIDKAGTIPLVVKSINKRISIKKQMETAATTPDMQITAATQSAVNGVEPVSVRQAKDDHKNKEAGAETTEPHPYLSIDLPPASTKLSARLTHHRFYHYWRLAAAIGFINLLVLLFGATTGNWWSSEGIAIGTLLNVAALNISLAILIRQQYVINLLFKVATSVPLSVPLSFRRLMGKVYHFGGLHIGGAVCGTLVLFIALVSMIVQSANDLPGVQLSATTLLLGLLLLLNLCALIVLAVPTLRQQFHNQFEKMHRFGGWLSLGLFWALAISLVVDTATGSSLSSALFNSLSFWLLIILTISIILPWLRLRKIDVEYERPSDHVVIARFNYGVTPFAGSATTLSRNPLTEWHSFANVPAPGVDGYRLTISRGGDWTGRLIDDLPSKLWVKGIPTAGVGNVDKLFKKVVWIATGSGIGPTLPHLLAQEVPAHLIWATRNARTTYGDKMVDEILNVEPNALIWDTDSLGRPDLVHLAHSAVKEFDAEAVIVISNEKLTRLVVHGMESRGIPAFGAIWDS